MSWKNYIIFFLLLLLLLVFTLLILQYGIYRNDINYLNDLLDKSADSNLKSLDNWAQSYNGLQKDYDELFLLNP
jgi:thiosulfate reductase cytochrome b subunit